MKPTKGQKQSVTIFQVVAQRLAEELPTKTKSFFLALIFGALLAVARRRTVTQWLNAAQIGDDFRSAFYHLPNVGRKSEVPSEEITDIIIKKLGGVIETATFIRFVLDDSPTKRHGRKIKGAGHHHDPTPGRTNAKTCFGDLPSRRSASPSKSPLRAASLVSRDGLFPFEKQAINGSGFIVTERKLQPRWNGRSPIVFQLSPGQAADDPQGRMLIPKLPEYYQNNNISLLMDKAYEGDSIRSLAVLLGLEPVVPPKSNRVEPWP